MPPEASRDAEVLNAVAFGSDAAAVACSIKTRIRAMGLMRTDLALIAVCEFIFRLLV